MNFLRLHTMVKPRSNDLRLGCVDLAHVSVVVALHFLVEDLGLFVLGALDEAFKQLENIVTEAAQLILDSLLVLFDEVDVLAVALGLLVVLVLLDVRERAPGSSARGNRVFVTD